MNQDLESLFTPWKIGNCEIKNRIVMTSMGGTSIFGWMEPHHFDQEAANYLLEKAQNNVGLILPGIAPVRNMLGGQWLYKADGAFAKLKDFMDEIHKTDTKMFVQLTAGFGRSFSVSAPMEMMVSNPILKAISKPIFDVERLCAGPSEAPNRWSDKVPSRPLTVQEIHDLVDGFAKTAKKCQEAGVDGVEIHAYPTYPADARWFHHHLSWDMSCDLPCDLSFQGPDPQARSCPWLQWFYCPWSAY